MNKRRKRDRLISSISDHKRAGKSLIPPLAQVAGRLALSSWVNERMPDLLWAALLTTTPRDGYLEIFRGISDRAIRHKGEMKLTIKHGELAKLTASDFDALIAPLLESEEAKGALAPMLLFEGLPDRLHWERHLNQPDLSHAVQKLAEAVAKNFDHQSQAATDCRWLKVRYMVLSDHVVIGHSRAEEAYREILEYPNVGDMRKVRPSIRALEMTTADDHKAEPEWASQFWKEAWEKSECVIVPDTKPEASSFAEYQRQVTSVYEEVCVRFAETISSTEIDAKHDAAFGLALYAAYLAVEILSGGKDTRAIGPILIRTMCEAFICLAYLAKRDRPAEWLQFRNYGSGQAKLAFLKFLDGDSVPEYIDMSDLERFANEDMWLEYQEIDLGNWTKSNLRAMSEEAGVKDIYDKYYLWPSAYVHAQWPSIRDTTFTTCLNPLHRFHRIPRPPRNDMRSTAISAMKLLNLTLDKLDSLFPPFKPRIHID